MRAVNIPIIANGDVTSYEDGSKWIEESGTPKQVTSHATGCQGVMIGRAGMNQMGVFNPEGTTVNASVSGADFMRRVGGGINK